MRAGQPAAGGHRADARRRAGLTAALALLAGAIACGGGGDEAPSLPPLLDAALAVDAVLDPAAVAARDPASCRTEADSARAQRRRTVHATDADGATRLVFVRAALADSALERVEVVHRPAGGQQLGLSWSAREDAVRVVGYRPADLDSAASLSYDAREAARRLRAIGARAMALACPGG